jgi:hypothetical protein
MELWFAGLPFLIFLVWSEHIYRRSEKEVFIPFGKNFILYINNVASAKKQPVAESKYIGTRQQSHMSSHAVPHRIFDDVEEREQGERKRSLPRETTTS